MKKILVTGSLGQIGSELVLKLREVYGMENVIATDIRHLETNKVCTEGIFEILDVTDADALGELYNKYKPDTLIHLASLLSATAEEKPLLAWKINMGGLINTLELAREKSLQYFTPSSIGAFGPLSPKKNTPQDTIQRPKTMYGITKVSGELLCDYYFSRYGVDTRGVRFPGLISYVAHPGGGTTDYAVEIFYEALKNNRYASYIDKDTFMDMMYMPDAVKAIIDLMEADPKKLIHRNAFNISAMSIDPVMLGNEIKKHLPEFELTFDVDPRRQGIAASWPDCIDVTAAREEWGFKADYDLAAMTKDMLEKLRIKLELEK